MKNKLFLFVAILSLSCTHHDDKPANPIDKLPPATQTGANTAGCLVNGEAFLPKGYFPGGGALYFVYQDGLNFSLAISQNVNNHIKSVNVASLNQNLHDNIGVVFPLTEYGANSKYGEYTINAEPSPSPNSYSTTTTVRGELKITHHDFDHAIMSGTFWFDAINSNGEKVQVREGRFDMHY